ncbi:hypothetical protein PIB30_086845, partial [Stylosanthes scabra]|nr:hypothetical protein [Stylosanthes scabra]
MAKSVEGWSVFLQDGFLQKPWKGQAVFVGLVHEKSVGGVPRFLRCLGKKQRIRGRVPWFSKKVSASHGSYGMGLSVQLDDIMTRDVIG